MRNVLAMAQKELKSYFASPIAWIVLGFWALLFGYFFVAILQFFVRQSMQVSQFGMQGPQVTKAVKFFISLYEAFVGTDASLAEINPLIITKDGDLLAIAYAWEQATPRRKPPTLVEQGLLGVAPAREGRTAQK